MREDGGSWACFFPSSSSRASLSLSLRLFPSLRSSSSLCSCIPVPSRAPAPLATRYSRQSLCVSITGKDGCIISLPLSLHETRGMEVDLSLALSLFPTSRPCIHCARQPLVERASLPSLASDSLATSAAASLLLICSPLPLSCCRSC